MAAAKRKEKKSSDHLPPRPGNGRQTFNSTILRPKIEKQNDLIVPPITCYTSTYSYDDEDDVSALPSNFSSRHSLAKYGVDNKLDDFDDDNIYENSKHLVSDNSSNASLGTLSSDNSNITLQTIQSFARKKDDAFDEFSKKLLGEEHKETANKPEINGSFDTKDLIKGTEPPQCRSSINSGHNTASAEEMISMNRVEAKDKNVDGQTIKGPSTSATPLGMGGIAAAAAQAAIKRNNRKNMDRQTIIEPSASMSPLGIGGLAAAAAQAALKRKTHVN
mmetsp:Transcript_9690/g.14528  ORF Transcript_9690/g.14528 Transcript_9690/m.14528 type:complete len:276 (-) Transcript_9690:30-857(-)